MVKRLHILKSVSPVKAYNEGPFHKMKLKSHERGSQMTQQLQAIHHEFHKLSGPTLSIYLLTAPARSDWKIRFKNGMNRMSEYIECSSPDQLDLFAMIRQKVERKIQDYQTILTNSLVCFATSDHILFYRLQIPVQNDFQWRRQPATDQLHQLLQKYPKSAILLLQHGKVTMITSQLGEILKQITFLFNFQTHRWQLLSSSSNDEPHSFMLPQRDVRNFQKNVSRWYRQITPTIRQYLHKNQSQQIYVTGPASLRKALTKNLQIKITSEKNHNYANKTAQHILKEMIPTPVSTP